LFFFSNILEYLQVLVFFFIVPLFGTVILGMLWKRATPAGGFWGFLTAILVSIWMWAYVHTFPDGYRPQPKVTLSRGAVVTLEKQSNGKTEAITKITVQSGTVDLVNVPVAATGGLNGAITLPASIQEKSGEVKVQILAPEVVLSDSRQTTKFGVEGVAATLQAGVQVRAKTISEKFAPAAFNPAHARLIARSEKAKPMAVNMYSGWWSLVVCVVVTVLVSLFTKPKPDAELKNLVMGLTPLPDEGPCPWHKQPLLWAAVITVVLVAVNIIFW
jgi:Na+/proline symporter